MRKMGGLRTKIPWTFLDHDCGTFAIAGIPGLAGFFSKDEILWQAYQASWAYWLVGVVTAFITSFYMFRLWFMTFFGEYRGETDAAHDHAIHGTSAHGAHGHGHGGVHESPNGHGGSAGNSGRALSDRRLRGRAGFARRKQPL
jgi:NADH-quinone oxidoreductase subunit L